VLVATAAANVTGGDPVQVMSFTNSGSAGNYELAIGLNSTGAATSVSGTLKYIIYAGNTTYATIDDSNAGIASGIVTGHELLPDVNTIGAVAAGSSPAEPYSSVGLGEIYCTASGTPLATPTDEGKVDVLAPNGIATSVSGFSAFYGTSAAAPDAAAVATLLLEANPNLTSAEISADIDFTATPVSGNTLQDGAGEVNADAALAAAYGSAWTIAAGGDWSNAAGWSGGVLPGASSPVTLDDDIGRLSAGYTVTVDIPDAAAETLTVGNDTDLRATLTISAGKPLSVAGGATVGGDGSVIDAGTFPVGGDLSGTGGIPWPPAAC
jgi:subtilisin family serine protease